MRERRVWRAPAWICPDLWGIADPGQEPDGDGRVELHREQYVSREDAERCRQYAHWIPGTKGWTGAHREENHPGDILESIGRALMDGQVGRPPPARGVGWPSDVVGLLVTPGSMRLDRGQLEHPKKRLRERPTTIMTCSRGWRGVAGSDTDLVIVVRHAPTSSIALALHRIARTVRRDGGDSAAHLLLNADDVAGGPIPADDDLHQCAWRGADRFVRLVDLAHHRSGDGLVVDGAGALPGRFAQDAALRFPEVLQVSVREDLLDDAGDVDRIAKEVSSMLLTTAGVSR